MTVGETVMDAPVPTNVPPQDPVYQLYEEPVPSVPPFAVNVVDAPLQIALLPATLVGAVEGVLTVTVTAVLVLFTQLVPFQVRITCPSPERTPVAVVPPVTPPR